jgi:hypothetical protein
VTKGDISLANPESGFSLTFKINDPKGIENMITMRSESNELPDISALLEDHDTLVDQIIANNWAPIGGRPQSNNNSQSSNNDNAGNTNSGRGSTYGGGSRNNRQSNNNNSGNVENCRCGVPGVRKSGNKNGRSWSAIMCATRNCDPLFDN